MVIFGTSLNFGAKGGGSSAFTANYYGSWGNYACSAFNIEGTLNSSGYNFSSFCCLPFKSSKGLYYYF